MPRLGLRPLVGLASLFLQALGLAGPAAAARVALVIGNDAYAELPVLEKAGADAESFAALLRAKGFDRVFVHRDLTRTGMDLALAEFLDAIEPGDTALFVYSGHGWSDGTQNFLVGVDAPRTGAEAALARISVPLQNGANGVLDEIGRRGAALKVAIIDACRNNPFASPVAGRSIGLGRGLSRVDPPRGTFVIFSAGTGQEALDRLSDTDPSPNSVFTRTLVPLLARDLPLLDAVKEVQQQVYDIARSVDHEQEPAYYDQVRGDACLFGECAGGSVPAPDREAMFWGAIASSTNPADFEAYLQQFGDGGAFAILARNRLAALTPPDAPLPPAIEPEPPSLAVVFEGGVRLEESFTLDVATGTLGSDDADLWFHGVSDSEAWLEPRNGAAIAVVHGPGCGAATLSAARVPLAAVVPDAGLPATLCVRSGDGVLAELTVNDILRPNGFAILDLAIVARR